MVWLSHSFKRKTFRCKICHSWSDVTTILEPRSFLLWHSVNLEGHVREKWQNWKKIWANICATTNTTTITTPPPSPCLGDQTVFHQEKTSWIICITDVHGWLMLVISCFVSDDTLSFYECHYPPCCKIETEVSLE